MIYVLYFYKTHLIYSIILLFHYYIPHFIVSLYVRNTNPSRYKHIEVFIIGVNDVMENLLVFFNYTILVSHIYSELYTYGTAQFKLYTRVRVHACACTFIACKTLKIGVHKHCRTRFCRAHSCN